jgi:subtilase family serine protease
VDINPANQKDNPGDLALEDKVIITCDGKLTVDYEKNIASFNDNVKVEKPDLIIEDVMLSANNGILYKIKNIGNAIAGPSYSKLWVDGSYAATDYVAPLINGTSRDEYIFTYTWSCSGYSDDIKVCADANGQLPEKNEANNCRTETWICPPPTPPPSPPSGGGRGCPPNCIIAT